MRARLVLVLAVSLAALPLSGALAGDGVVLAQDVREGEEGQLDPEQEAGGSERQGGEAPESEVGAGEETTKDAPAETGPQWTYQMARISLGLLALGLLGIGLLYFRLVIGRQRGEI